MVAAFYVIRQDEHLNAVPIMTDLAFKTSDTAMSVFPAEHVVFRCGKAIKP